MLCLEASHWSFDLLAAKYRLAVALNMLEGAVHSAIVGNVSSR